MDIRIILFQKTTFDNLTQTNARPYFLAQQRCGGVSPFHVRDTMAAKSTFPASSISFFGMSKCTLRTVILAKAHLGWRVACTFRRRRKEPGPRVSGKGDMLHCLHGLLAPHQFAVGKVSPEAPTAPLLTLDRRPAPRGGDHSGSCRPHDTLARAGTVVYFGDRERKDCSGLGQRR